MHDTNEPVEQVSPSNHPSAVNAPRSGKSNGKIEDVPGKLDGPLPPTDKLPEGDDIDYEAAAAPDPEPQDEGTQIGARPTVEELEAAVDGGPIGDVGKVEEVYERREPRKEAEFFRTHPDLKLWIETVLLVDKEGFDKPVYLVGQQQRPLLQNWLKRALLVPCINQDGEFFIWPIVIADIALGQRSTRSEQGNREIAQRAIKEWVCRVWVRSKHIASPADENGIHLGDKGKPQFPEGLTRTLILARTFTGAFIGHNDHEMIRIYRGRTKR